MIREHRYRAKSKPQAGRGSHGTSWKGVMLGSLTTFVIILTLGGAVGLLLAAIFVLLGISGAAEEGVVTGLVGVSLTLLLAFFLGGYVAGRTASRSGVKHSLLVALLALVAAMFLAVVGVLLGSGLVNGISGVRFPSTLDDLRNIGAIMPVFEVVTLILPFVVGARGGVRAAKMSRKRKS
jgi:hypothetical protein